MTITDDHLVNGFPQVNGRPQQTQPPSVDDIEQPGTAPKSAVSSANKGPRRVRKLRDKVTEARGIVELQGDPALTEADTPKVLRERRDAAEALKLHTLGQDPARKALRDNRVRRAVAFIGGAGLVGALGWSTANVQHAVTTGQKIDEWSPPWLMAFLVEPMVSVGLLLIFGVRAYIAVTRGYAIEDDRLTRVERSLLAITLTVNSWDYLPLVAPKFDPLQLLVHSIGPVVAVLLVTVIPVLWGYIGEIDLTSAPADPDLARWMTVARRLIAEGLLDPAAGRNATERALREHGGKISTSVATRVYRCLTGNVRL